MARTKQTARRKPAAAPTPHHLPPDQARVGHHTPSHVLYYCYQAAVDARTDDLGELLQRKREDEVQQSLMKISVHREMSRVLDTGVRVNAGLASAMGVAHDRDTVAARMVEEHHARACVGKDSIAVKTQSPLSLRERIDQKVVLVGVVW